MWWHTSVMPALGSRWQEHLDFNIILGYKKRSHLELQTVPNNTEEDWKRKNKETNWKTWIQFSQRAIPEAILTTAPLTSIWASLEIKASEMNGDFRAIKRQLPNVCITELPGFESIPNLHWYGFCFSIFLLEIQWKYLKIFIY